VNNKLHQRTQQNQQIHAHAKEGTRVGKDNRDIELAQYSNDIYSGCPEGNSLCTDDTTDSVLFAVLKKTGRW